MDSSNKENILKELTNFEVNSNEVEEIPEILDNYLISVARSGDIIYEWQKLKPFLKKKIELIATEFNESHPYNPVGRQPNVRPFDFDEVKQSILTGLDSFHGAPFTIQRICELLTNPYLHYKRADKFLKGLEKNVIVVSENNDDRFIENGNTSSSGSSCLNATFALPSTSGSTMDTSQHQSSLFHNGYKESENDFTHNNLPQNLSQNISQNISQNLQQQQQQQPSTIQQLDSFTTVFVSSQSIASNNTNKLANGSPLERIASLPILDDSSTPPLSSSTNIESNDTTTSDQQLESSSEIEADLTNNTITNNSIISQDATSDCQSIEKIAESPEIITSIDGDQSLQNVSDSNLIAENVNRNEVQQMNDEEKETIVQKVIVEEVDEHDENLKTTDDGEMSEQKSVTMPEQTVEIVDSNVDHVQETNTESIQTSVDQQEQQIENSESSQENLVTNVEQSNIQTSIENSQNKTSDLKRQFDCESPDKDSNKRMKSNDNNDELNDLNNLSNNHQESKEDSKVLDDQVVNTEESEETIVMQKVDENLDQVASIEQTEISESNEITQKAAELLVDEQKIVNTNQTETLDCEQINTDP